MSLHTKMRDTRELLGRLFAQVKKLDLSVGPDDALRPYADALVNKCRSYDLDYAAVAAGGVALTHYSELVEAHRQLIWTEHSWAISRALYDATVDDAIAFDDVQNARAARSGWYRGAAAALTPAAGRCTGAAARPAHGPAPAS